MLNGVPLDAQASYRIATIDFLTTSGDGFTVLHAGANKRPVRTDIDLTEAYLKAHPGYAPGPLNRIQRRN